LLKKIGNNVTFGHSRGYSGQRTFSRLSVPFSAKLKLKALK
jgi:hypothetical protein